MSVRVYRDLNGDFKRENDKIPAGNYALIYNEPQTKARIENVNTGVDLVEQMDISDFLDESGVGYPSVAFLEGSLAGLFNYAGEGKIREVKTVGDITYIGKSTTNNPALAIWDVEKIETDGDDVHFTYAFGAWNDVLTLTYE